MRPGDKVGIVSCSNGIQPTKKEQMECLEASLRRMGLEPVCSSYVYARDDVFSGTARQRAAALMEFYEDPDVKAIFDVSGGDIANEVLPYLDFERIGSSGKQFWGYSDLTTIVNAIYTKTGQSSVLYQVRNLAAEYAKAQQADFHASVLEGKGELFDFPYEFLQGSRMEGVVVGGNIRCFLKLAGTPYWPDLSGKILLLEAWSGRLPQMTTYLSQLEQMGIFRKVSGILLGTFTQLEQEGYKDLAAELVRRYAGPDLCIARTGRIGHGKDSKAIEIGRELCLC